MAKLGPPCGERNGHSWLTAKQVLKIRECLAKGETKTSLARRLGVSHHTIYSIAVGRTWKHVR